MSRPTYAIVTGGRHYDDRCEICYYLDELAPALVFHGGASGADELADEWCDNRGVPAVIMPALWTALGKAAGPRRNGWLLSLAQSVARDRGAELVCLAVVGGVGTADMTGRCRAAGVRVVTPP